MVPNAAAEPAVVKLALALKAKHLPRVPLAPLIILFLTLFYPTCLCGHSQGSSLVLLYVTQTFLYPHTPPTITSLAIYILMTPHPCLQPGPFSEAPDT